MTMMIGGKCDGNEVPARVLTMTEKGETYILMSFKEDTKGGQVKHFYYMLAGMVPAEAQKAYCVRAGLIKSKIEVEK